MDREDVDGVFVVIDLYKEEVFAWCESEEDAKRAASYANRKSSKKAGSMDFAVCRLELLE